MLTVLSGSLLRELWRNWSNFEQLQKSVKQKLGAAAAAFDEDEDY